MEKIIHSLISNWIKGVDTYTHNGSTWLIFTDSKKWVIELTESKTLWYNYNFFKQIFEFTSLDVVENQHYITKWVEDNIINKVKHTVTANNHIFDRVEDAIQNGVKHTEKSLQIDGSCVIEDTVQNGVKSTISTLRPTLFGVDDIIQDGVKETFHFDEKHDLSYEQGVKKLVEDTIENGVKHTEIGWHQCNNIDDAIEYGVKEIFDTEFMPQSIVNDIIQNGVKETKTPGKDGDIMSTIEWMEENKSTSYTKMIDDVIDNGEKINGTYVGGKRQKENVEVVIDYGVKKIKADSSQNPMGKVTDVIKNGVKETKVCNFLDPNTNLVYVRWPEDIEEVIYNGTKNPTV